MFCTRKITFESIGGLRARRKCAEQGSPGSQPIKPKWRKGVTAMAKYVFCRLRYFVPAALVITGWLSFALGIVMFDECPAVRLVLLSVARVLP